MPGPYRRLLRHERWWKTSASAVVCVELSHDGEATRRTVGVVRMGRQPGRAATRATGVLVALALLLGLGAAACGDGGEDGAAATGAQADSEDTGTAFVFTSAPPAMSFELPYLPGGLAPQYADLALVGGGTLERTTGTVDTGSLAGTATIGTGTSRLQVLADAAGAASMLNGGGDGAFLIVTATPTVDVDEDQLHALLSRRAHEVPSVVGGDGFAAGTYVTGDYAIEARGRGVSTADVAEILRTIRIEG
jgi:hypothetical protein